MMADNRWSNIKKLLLRLWRFFWPIIRFTIRVAVIGGVLAGAWYSFVWLVGKPPIDTTPALIMTWASVAVLLFAFFPKIIDRVKRVKVKDFELELQETVAQAASGDFISPSDLEGELLFTEKADFRNLQSIMEQADQQPSIPILLVVNVRNGRRISVPMLFTYLFLLDIFSLSTIVLFVNQKGRLRRLSDIEKNFVLGATSGKKALWTFYRRFPALLRMFGTQYYSHLQTSDRINLPRIPSLDFINSLSSFVREEIRSSRRGFEEQLSERDFEDSPEYLSINNVTTWFRGLLSSRTIDVSLSEGDSSVIRSAFEANDDFVLLFKNDGLASIIILCQLASKLTRRALAS